ncbi:hypothetical protein BKM31_19110 [[Actinomadura] parvosata subsp. kistnae]|uniref:Uncharacterized protein n=1 Tax=[Actinomadura] parvosata subsp. kistnae TaxID=1909395 RepID=A0A1U9ZZB2_9ACTN|nr:hypothetical protein [Nonomuraea sp. ATCC 55076]AQZ63291.1 hypothetical protein BKM31_19110 [Nonomuraea sp. ATCC 55076]
MDINAAMGGLLDHLERVRESFEELHLLLVDGDNRIVAAGWGVPVRWNGNVEDLPPTLKARYPLTPMSRFMTRTRPDGAPLDPWLRTHHRMGAWMSCPAERSMVMTGSAADWEKWADMSFPESGSYVVPGALVPVMIDRQHDRGELVESNVWVQRR